MAEYITIKKAREILGNKYDRLSDEEIQGTTNTLRMIANIAIDATLKMTPEQRKRFEKETQKG